MTVRAFFQTAKVETVKPPYDTIYLKILYPAQMSGSHTENNLGIVPVDRQKAPFPVVIFFNGFNCEAHIYQWLAMKLVERGLVVVTFNWIAENLPGVVSITPGVDITTWKPEIYGTVPTSSTLSTLLAKLEQLQAEGILAGMLDLERVILGGHSAGGRVAIENANPGFFPQVAASFAYAAHSMGGTMMGYEPGTILPLPDSLPMLLIGGTHDGVIANSSDRYGITSGDATTAVMRTFQEAITGGRNDNYLVFLEGANHFIITDPFDSTTGRAFLDFPTTESPAALRLLMADIIGLFIDAHVRHQTEAFHELNRLLNNSNNLIQSWQNK
ncbi:dienelactone hydrolase [Westiellopsis prolifica IICB1]|nr:dienelactone hydrolase [Westiellopsis prolifica IICB1]